MSLVFFCKKGKSVKSIGLLFPQPGVNTLFFQLRDTQGWKTQKIYFFLKSRPFTPPPLVNGTAMKKRRKRKTSIKA